MLQAQCDLRLLNNCLWCQVSWSMPIYKVASLLSVFMILLIDLVCSVILPELKKGVLGLFKVFVQEE